MIKTYELPPLSYAYDALEPGYSAEILELHHTKHHKGYVDGANKTLESLKSARREGDFEKLNQLQKNLAFNVSGHILHSLFWKNLQPPTKSEPGGDLAAQIKQDFGGFDGFRQQFSAAGASIQGSGWTALSWEPLSQSLVVEQVYDHQGNIGNGTVPVLVMDMWEHAFYLQYKNEKKKWIKAFWDLVNWDDAEERLGSVRSLNLQLG